MKQPTCFPMPSPRYYQRAIEIMLGRDPEMEFYVFSDDIDWCKKAFGSDNMVFVDGTPRPVEVEDRQSAGKPQDYPDLFAMSFCRHHIIANSTFSWWAAYLSGDSEVIYPSRWFGRHPIVRDIPWRLMIPDSWQEVQA